MAEAPQMVQRANTLQSNYKVFFPPPLCFSQVLEETVSPKHVVRRKKRRSQRKEGWYCTLCLFQHISLHTNTVVVLSDTVVGTNLQQQAGSCCRKQLIMTQPGKDKHDRSNVPLRKHHSFWEAAVKDVCPLHQINNSFLGRAPSLSDVSKTNKGAAGNIINYKNDAGSTMRWQKHLLLYGGFLLHACHTQLAPTLGKLSLQHANVVFIYL